ncbi:MAG TPA: YhjD/YihY/BrkB family envelope integrity protein [Kribbella sp.]|nr:YhjD/YihY/BrkB family envelope integrity protein [Kribbella sp.]
MVLASQAFTALIPLLILVSALAPVDEQNVVADALIHRFELEGDAAGAVEQVFAHSGEATTGVLSVVLLLFSGISLARRMQRMYLLAWRLEPRAGIRGSLNAAVGLAALLIEFGLLYLLRSLVRRLPSEWVLGAPLTALASLILWTSVPWLLLDRRIRWRRLLPTGALAAVCASVYGAATTIYMPRLMESYSQRYGLFGVTLALVGWLLCICLIVVAATVVAAEFDRAQEPWARRLRSRLRLEQTSDRPAADTN